MQKYVLQGLTPRFPARAMANEHLLTWQGRDLSRSGHGRNHVESTADVTRAASNKRSPPIIPTPQRATSIVVATSSSQSRRYLRLYTVIMGRCVLLGLLVLYLLHTEGAEERPSVKRARAPALTEIRPRQEDAEVVRPRAEDWDSGSSSSDTTAPTSNVPAGFLSPSVQEYLELGKAIPGRPGTDYPVLATVPYTNFYCDEQPYPGFFADMDTRCQAWHYCDIDGRQASFLCPNGTQFNQAVFVCDWWFNVRCDLSPALYVINDRLYRRPRHDVAKPHRTITKELLENIFV
ncbi:hypothetical protein B566_EDAN016681 [Ephemera danica]|nr:hypothetical protein B566_EDAN016681 [Ephemera danica]